MNTSTIIDKIRKLFALGDKTRNPNEGEVKTALSMASKLMKEHNLTLGEIDLEKQKENIGKEYTQSKKSISFWERKLARTVGKLFDCDNILFASYKRCWAFIGFKEEAKLATQCYEYLDNILRTMANAYAKNKLDFYAGITDRLQERVDEEIKLRTPQETSKCTAIVCCKDKLIKTWEKKNLKLTVEHRSIPKTNNVSPDYYKGYLAGGNLDLQNKPKIKEK